MSTYKQYTGLFGYVKDGTVRNVVLDSYSTIRTAYSSRTSYTGGLVGYCYGYDNDATVENCVNMGYIYYNTTSMQTIYIGGIVGYTSPSYFKVTIRN